MPEQRIRRWSALAAIVFSLLLAGLLAHGVREAIEVGHEHWAHGALAACFVFATLLAPLALSLTSPRGRPHRTAPTIAPQRIALRPRVPRPARASPAWLQRFRN